MWIFMLVTLTYVDSFGDEMTGFVLTEYMQHDKTEYFWLSLFLLTVSRRKPEHRAKLKSNHRSGI